MKESFESLMGWEKETFKIDSTGRKETEKGGKKVKVSPAGDVFEYLDGSTKGEQIFLGYDNFLKYVASAKGCTPEEAEKRYLMTPDQFEEKMKQIETSEGGYEAFYDKEIASHLAGYFATYQNMFYWVGYISTVWMANNNTATFDNRLGYCNDHNNHLGYGARLLKFNKL